MANPLGLSLTANFLVQNMIAAELAAKSALSTTGNLRFNDLGGDKGWYFFGVGKLTMRDIVLKVTDAITPHLYESTTYATPSVATTRATHDKVHLVSTKDNGTTCYVVVASHGNDAVLEIKENNPTPVEWKEVPRRYQTCEEEVRAFNSYLKGKFPTGLTIHGWLYGTGPQSLSVEDIVNNSPGAGWCSIM